MGMNNWKSALLLLIIVLLMVVPVYAQEEEVTPAVEPTALTTTVEEEPLAGVAEETSTDTATGLPILVLLLGLSAIAVVGGVTIMRENYKPQAPKTE